MLEYKFNLGNDRFATVGLFKGEMRIGVRQYEKGTYDSSRVFPTKVGISLVGQEWKKLASYSDNITEDIIKGNLNEYQISDDIYVGLSRFGEKGVITVSIRKHFTCDDGVRRPTKMGINLRKSEWEELVSVKHLVNESVDNLKSTFMHKGKTVVKSVCVYFADKKCYQYGVVETGEVFYSPLEEPVEAYKSYLKYGA